MRAFLAILTAVTLSPIDAVADELPPEIIRSSREAPIAVDPPPDWAVLHAGLRPELGTFGGLATLALARARTEHFYGVASLAGVNNVARVHVGLLQLTFGGNEAENFYGGAQLAATMNTARNFVGVGRFSVAYNHGERIVALAEAAAYNRTTSFAGILQFGGYSHVHETFGGFLMLGGANEVDGTFSGVAQIAAVNRAGNLFGGVLQLGFVNAVGSPMFEESHHRAGAFKGVAQIGGSNFVDGDFHGLGQLGGINRTTGTFHGAQIGLVNYAEHVAGLQIGLFNAAQSLAGVQLGLVNHAETGGMLPWTGILNIGFGEPTEPGRDFAKAAF